MFLRCILQRPLHQSYNEVFGELNNFVNYLLQCPRMSNKFGNHLEKELIVATQFTYFLYEILLLLLLISCSTHNIL